MFLTLFICFFINSIYSIEDDNPDDNDNPEIDNNDNDEDISNSSLNKNHQISWDDVPVHDVIIIGSGPAGSTAGLYLGRSGYKPLILHGHQSGGQLTMTCEVENFPTFKGTGTQLVRAIQSQAEQSGSMFIEDTIITANLTVNPKRLTSLNGHQYRSKTVIIATGAKARTLGLKSEQKYMNKGVSFCASCDGQLFKGQKVAVIGGGDSALTEALMLSKLCSSVTLIYRSENPTASLPLKKKLFQSNITVISGHSVVEIIGDEYVTGVQIKNVKNDEFSVLSVSAVFVAIGRIPESSVFADEIGVDRRGYFVKRPSMSGDSTATKVPGVFVAGDCADPVYRQAITSAGTGCQAALDAERYLNSLDE